MFATLLMVTASALLSVTFIAASIFNHRPNGAPAAVEIRVEQGDSLAAVVRKLRAQKLISNERLFLLWARLRRVETKIHLGLYRFEAPVPAREILERLTTGKGMFYKVTIPEGLTVKEIAALLAKMQIADGEKFLTVASAPELLATLGAPKEGIEGYLFPSTYYFMPSTPEKNIILAMAEQFRKTSWPVLERSKGAQELTPHQLITLASIIEKETGIEAERPLISAVFHNRLKLGMPLQSDPTVIYGLKDFQGNLTRKHLQDPNPYNTYRIPGLPPGPICNPGLSSIKAALEPADVPYLYFVSKNDGSHQFSANLEAHNHAVKTFQPVAPSTGRTKITKRRR
ncbi:MAG: endolytic transglycosylase MltG [Candidatus Binatia bacterium]